MDEPELPASPSSAAAPEGTQAIAVAPLPVLSPVPAITGDSEFESPFTLEVVPPGRLGKRVAVVLRPLELICHFITRVAPPDVTLATTTP